MKKLNRVFAVLAAVLTLGLYGCSNAVNDSSEYCEVRVSAGETARSVITSDYKIADVTSWTLTATNALNAAETYTDTNTDYTKLVVKLLKGSTFNFVLQGTVTTSQDLTATVKAVIDNKTITENTTLAFTVKPILATDTTDTNAKGRAVISLTGIDKSSAVGTKLRIGKIKGYSGNGAAVTKDSLEFTVDGNNLSYSTELPTGLYTVSFVCDDMTVLTKNFAVEKGLNTTVAYTQAELAAYKFTPERMYNKHYLCFTSTGSFTLKAERKQWDGTVQYSVDGGKNWSDWDGTVKNSGKIGSNYYIFLRGKNVTKFSDNFDTEQKLKIESAANVDCYGNIMTLLNYENPASAAMGDSCFEGLFRGCSKLTKAPELPAGNLSKYCYSHMFLGTSIAAAPELPATTLANSCYQNMFYNCKALTTAPALPATTLADSCYSGMFFNCTSLTTAPALPATNLADSCYQNMFYNCTSLATAPALPATNLADNCYNSMFLDCTSLATAPALPATDLADYCYQSMFQGCTSLATAPELPATNLTYYCYYYMFQDCTALTTAPALPATTLADNCYNSMFLDCTSLATAPALPATDLADYCYQSMFQGCTSLATAPALPATTLANNCYFFMFQNCESLIIHDSNPDSSYMKILTVPDEDLPSNAVDFMFSGTALANEYSISTPQSGCTYYYEP